MTPVLQTDLPGGTARVKLDCQEGLWSRMNGRIREERWTVRCRAKIYFPIGLENSTIISEYEWNGL
jgi:hypothetical protein